MSDVCSSDRALDAVDHSTRGYSDGSASWRHLLSWTLPAQSLSPEDRLNLVASDDKHHPKSLSQPHGSSRDRKSVAQGKSVSVRVDIGGRRIIKKRDRKVANI